MSLTAARQSEVWLRQAQSDWNTAKALVAPCPPPPMRAEDVGCHVAALCAQVIEKSLKAYVILNELTPASNHRPDKYLSVLLNRSLLKHVEHYGTLAKLFDAGTKSAISRLLDLTPGGLGNRKDVPNTEYPWLVNGEWHRVPCGASEFSDPAIMADWVAVAKRVHTTLTKLRIAVERGPAL